MKPINEKKIFFNCFLLYSPELIILSDKQLIIKFFPPSITTVWNISHKTSIFVGIMNFSPTKSFATYYSFYQDLEHYNHYIHLFLSQSKCNTLILFQFVRPSNL